MSKISTYEVAPVPKLADKLIGTSVGGEIEDVTYNFTLQELLDVFLPVIPANNLQGVLDYGNTATQDINLFGTITTTNLDVTDTANFLDSYFVGETHIEGGLFDATGSIGTAGQVLTSTGTSVDWVTLPPIFTPNLQQVLTVGNTSTIGIILTAGLEATDVDTNTATINTNITIDGTITDEDASVGTSGSVLSSTVTGVKWVPLPVYSATSPLLFNSATGVFSIQQATNFQDGYLSSSDWITFDGKQNAGNYITALTGEVSASGPGSASATVSNAAVIGKVLTGFNPTAGTINAADTILTAFGKTQSQINALVGGVQYQGVWNASTNVPTLTSSVGVQGHYYVVNVAGNTNLNGITDWQIGDWAIFSESVWQKVDNTESVSSVNGFTGAVSLTTDNIPEGSTNLYFLNSRARLALSATSPLGYDNSTGVFSIQQANISQNGYLSSTDWNTFNDKQNYLGGTGLVKSSAGTISYITDNSINWNTAYDNSIISAAVTGTGTKTLTLNQQDAGTITASWTDLGLTSVGVSMPSAFNVANSPLTSNGTIAITGAGVASQYIRGDGTLATLPTGGGGGGASVSYYLNGSINQGTIGGVTYYEMNKVPVIGAGTDFSRSTNGYIASFLTDVNDPALLQIPAGNWNFETYFNASSGGGSPTFYIELYKYDGVVFTLIASNSASPKLINDGTSIEAYFSALAVPQTALTLTDRLAVRIYVTTAGRTITLHTENSHLCQVITTFTTGITALNGLTAQVQNLTTGTSGTDFNINSLVDTHTFNLPVASATNTGKLSSTDWSTFNGKVPYTGANANVTLGAFNLTAENIILNSGLAALTRDLVSNYGALRLNRGAQGFIIPNILSVDRTYNLPDASGTIALTSNLSSYVPTSRTLTINGTTYDLSADRSWSITAGVSSVTASSPLASSGGSTPNITIQQSSGSQDGYLSSTDWTTFNNKQAAGNYITSLTGEATGTGPGATAVTLNNASVTAKVLTGINITGGTVQATDTMLTAFGKLQNQINGLIGSTIYQGTWNASTNTPALASGVGVRGYYYIVSVAGTTNLDGITDWFVGDWVIFDGTAWQQVDNTDSVTSVNGFTGAVSLTTDNISEGTTNLYFLNSRARTAISLTTTGTSGAATYNNTTGVFNIPNYTTDLSGYVTLDTNQTITGVKSFNTPIILNNALNLTFDASVTGFGNSFLVYANKVAPNYSILSLYDTDTAKYSKLYFDNTTNRTYTFPNASGTIALTSDLSGYVPTSRTLSINGVTYDLSADRSWTVTPNINATTTQDYTATAGQVTFTVSAGYTVGQLAVFYNGSKLASNEFTATNGTTFTLATACQVNDIVQAVSSVTGGGIGGTGTTNYIPKFTGSGTIGDSAITDDGTTVTLVSRALSGTSATFSGTGSFNQITFTGSTVGRIVFPSAGGVLNGSANLFWDNTNSYLGVGTNIPSAGVTSFSTIPAFQFKAAGAAPAMTFSDTLTAATYAAVFGLATANNHFITGTATGDFAIANQSTVAGAIVFGTGTTEKMRMTSAGTFSIGNTNSTYNLDVTGTGRFTSTLLLGGALSGTSATFSGSGAFGSTAMSSARLTITDGTSIAAYWKATNTNVATRDWTIITNNQNFGDFAIRQGNSQGADATSGTDRLFISNNGLIGIGTSNPQAFVNSSGFGNLVVGGGAGETGITIYSGTTGSSGLMFADATTGSGAYTGYIVYRHATDTMEIATGGGTPRLTITSSGNVGVGASPDYTFDVNKSISGNFISRILNTSSTGFGLYVQTNDNTKPGIRIANASGGTAIDLFGSGAAKFNNSVTIGNAGSAGTYYLDITPSTSNISLQGVLAGTGTAPIILQPSGGSVLMGLSTNSASARLALDAIGMAVYNGGFYRQCYMDSNIMYWYNGSNQASLTSAGVWTDASDISIKKDVIDIKYGLDAVLELKPRSYKMKNDDLEQVGFIAQEVEQVIAELVSTDNKGMKGLSYGQMTAVLVKAIQEQQAQIEELRKIVATK